MKVLYSRKDGVWKLADFGLSKRLSSQSAGFTSRGHGTNGYLAPEFLLCLEDKIPFNRQLDIWSLGCILYELVVARQLFVDNYYAMRCKDTGVLPDITFDGFFGENDKEPIRNAFTRMLSLDPEARPAARDLLRDFSSNYATTATQPRNIEIYEEFSMTDVMSRTELTITQEETQDVEGLLVETHEMGVGISEPEGQLPVDWIAGLGEIQNVRMSEQEATMSRQEEPELLEESETLELTAFEERHAGEGSLSEQEARMSRQEELPLSLEETETLELTTVEVGEVIMSEQEEQLPLSFEEKKALVLNEIEKDPSNFWSWHALSCLFASNDDVMGAIDSCKGCLQRSMNSAALNCRRLIHMELANLLVFQGKYGEAMAYSKTGLTQADLDEILEALSSPRSPQIRSIIPNQRRKEMSLERYIPKTLIANDSASNRS
jgi:Protein kinase domain